MKQATIRDVARKANVSVASVSRALNGHSNVRPDMRAKVLQAVEDLGYVPNAAARSLSMALSHTIGVVVPDLHGEFFSELFRGMDAGAGATGYQLLLSTMHADIGLAGQALRAMHGRVDGLIVMAPQVDSKALELLLPPSLPVLLLISNAHSKWPLLGVDNRAGAAAAVQHLHDIGREQIVHLMGSQENVDGRERRQGFDDAVHTLSPGARIIECVGDFGEESGRLAVRQLLDRGETFDALFAANDMMALGAMQELKRRGLDIPGDVAIVGFDDIPLARFMGLTTLRVHMAEIGEQAVRSLAALLDNQDAPESVMLAPDLIIRESSGG